MRQYYLLHASPFHGHISRLFWIVIRHIIKVRQHEARAPQKVAPLVEQATNEKSEPGSFPVSTGEWSPEEFHGVQNRKTSAFFPDSVNNQLVVVPLTCFWITDASLCYTNGTLARWGCMESTLPELKVWRLWRWLATNVLLERRCHMVPLHNADIDAEVKVRTEQTCTVPSCERNWTVQIGWHLFFLSDSKGNMEPMYGDLRPIWFFEKKRSKAHISKNAVGSTCVRSSFIHGPGHILEAKTTKPARQKGNVVWPIPESTETSRFFCTTSYWSTERLNPLHF